LNIELLPHQWDFLESRRKFLALIAGVGAGKTFTIGHYLINRVAKYPKALHFVGANTYGQLKNSTLNGVFSVFNDIEIPFSYNQSSGMLEFMNGRVLCKSMENFNSLRGIEVGSFILDEVRDLRQEAFDMMMGRLRDKNVGDDLQGRVVSSPSGFNWIFDYFHPSGKKNTKEFGYITASSYANTFLPKGYIESVQAQYDETFFKQEILGEFINITSGKVYYAFDRSINVGDIDFDGFGTTFIACDINVDPMCAVVFRVFNESIYVFDEFFLRNADTFMATHEWKKKYSGCTVIPDSTACNRKSSGMSDVEIIKGAGFKVEYTHNPFVRDRVNNTNRLFSQKRLIINPRCKMLINDLEKVVWNGGQLDQKTDKLLTHISDALGYGAWKLFPMIKRQEQKTIQL